MKLKRAPHAVLVSPSCRCVLHLRADYPTQLPERQNGPFADVDPYRICRGPFFFALLVD